MKSIHNLKEGKILKCQICAHKELLNVINLGVQPPCDSLLNHNKVKNKEKKFPLEFVFCENCLLGQINYVVPPKTLFYSDYPYRSGITKTLVSKLFNTSEMVKKKLTIPRNSLCVDIGSNDGTLLKGFKRYGFRVLGVEPTNISKIANKDGVETICKFFDEDTAFSILKGKGRASIITATNVFAHVPNLYSVMKGIDILLEDKGVFISESHYLLDLIKTLQYDSIYHEHLKYYTVHSLKKLFSYYNFEIFDVEHIKNYGGSIRVYACRKGKSIIKSNVDEFLEKEKELIKSPKKIFKQLKKKIVNNKSELRKIINNYKSQNKKVVGVGCPGRCSTILNFCGISNYDLDYIAEQSTSLKLNKFLPGMHIPIIDEKEMFENQPDLAILLSWHYADEIIKIIRKKGLKSKILIPLPEVSLV
tara:strand:- start:1090 stop:2343 length:1254 start_codon:yes stop_codon:yes gene_type:complete